MFKHRAVKEINGRKKQLAGSCGRVRGAWGW